MSTQRFIHLHIASRLARPDEELQSDAIEEAAELVSLAGTQAFVEAAGRHFNDDSVVSEIVQELVSGKEPLLAVFGMLSGLREVALMQDTIEALEGIGPVAAHPSLVAFDLLAEAMNTYPALADFQTGLFRRLLSMPAQHRYDSDVAGLLHGTDLALLDLPGADSSRAWAGAGKRAWMAYEAVTISVESRRGVSPAVLAHAQQDLRKARAWIVSLLGA